MNGYFLFGLATGLSIWVLSSAFSARSAKVVRNANGHWEFPINTLAQMLAIPAERRERFIAEVPHIFREMWNMMDTYPISVRPGAAWVDDEASELRVRVINSDDPELNRARSLGRGA